MVDKCRHGLQYINVDGQKPPFSVHAIIYLVVCLCTSSFLYFYFAKFYEAIFYVFSYWSHHNSVAHKLTIS